jgi:hypothetical protein
MTRVGMLIRLLAAGIAIIAITDYGFRTAQKTSEAENKVRALRTQLNLNRQKLGSAKIKTAELQTRIDKLTEELASRSEIERRLRREVLGIEDKPEPPAKPKAGKADRGLITAILSGVENPSVVIDDEILYEGDTIYGVKIVKIHTDEVELAKNSSTWTQQIDQPPPAVWGRNKK